MAAAAPGNPSHVNDPNRVLEHSVKKPSRLREALCRKKIANHRLERECRHMSFQFNIYLGQLCFLFLRIRRRRWRKHRERYLSGVLSVLRFFNCPLFTKALWHGLERP